MRRINTVCALLVMLSNSVFAKDMPAKSRVIIVKSAAVWNVNGSVNTAVLQKMLDAGIREFFQVDNPAAGWKKFFVPGDKVAIKVNCLAAAYANANSRYKASTSPELAGIVANGAIAAGVTPEDIVIYDRNSASGDTLRNEMIVAGYKLNESSGSVKVTQAGEFGPEETLSNGLKINFIKPLLEANKAVNMPILKGHHIMGFTFALKNHLGSYKDADLRIKSGKVPAGAASSLHNNAGVPGIAALNSHAVLKNKPSLIIGDLLRAQYRTAFYDPEGSWPYGGIIIANDPVAADAVALKILREKREQENINYFISAPLDVWYMASAAEKEQIKVYPEKMRYGGIAWAYLHDCAIAGLGTDNFDDINLKIIELP